MGTIRHIAGRDALRSMVGRELGVSSWREVDQALITGYAHLIDDRQWIHVDADRAAASRRGGTIAHGLLTLSLVPSMSEEVFSIGGVAERVNYGYDRVRFPSSVRTGSSIRDRVSLRSVHQRGSGTRIHLTHVVEVRGSDRPACVAEGITLLVWAD